MSGTSHKVTYCFMTLVRFTCMVLRTKLAIVSYIWFGLHVRYFAQSYLLFHDFGSVYSSGTSHKVSYCFMTLVRFTYLVLSTKLAIDCISDHWCFGVDAYHVSSIATHIRLIILIYDFDCRLSSCFFTIFLFSTLEDLHKQLGSVSFFLLLFFNCNFHFFFRSLSLRCSYHIFFRSLVHFSRDFSVD